MGASGAGRGRRKCVAARGHGGARRRVSAARGRVLAFGLCLRRGVLARTVGDGHPVGRGVPQTVSARLRRRRGSRGGGRGAEAGEVKGPERGGGSEPGPPWGRGRRALGRCRAAGPGFEEPQNQVLEQGGS